MSELIDKRIVGSWECEENDEVISFSEDESKMSGIYSTVKMSDKEHILNHGTFYTYQDNMIEMGHKVDGQIMPYEYVYEFKDGDSTLIIKHHNFTLLGVYKKIQNT